MIQFALGVLLGGFVGMAVTCMNVAASDRAESACAEAYEAGRRDGKNEGCAERECPAFERYIERGE